jgi:hypothetical protein
MTESAFATEHPDGGAPQAFFHQEWAQLEDALARTHSRVILRCKHTLARLVFDALVQCRRQGLQVHLSLPDTALNRQSAIAWERLSAIGGQMAWRQAASDGPDADASFPALAVVLDDACVFTGKLGAGTCPADDASEVPGLVSWGDADFVRQTRQVLDEEAGWLAHNAAPVGGESTARAVQLRQDGGAVQHAWLARVLQNHALATQAEIAETQRQMALFDHAQEQALGPLMRDYLRSKAQYLQHLALQDQAALEAARTARQRWDDYEAAQDAPDRETEPLSLDADALDQLKQLYRKLAMQCHPDRVADTEQDRAAQLFQSLQSSYRRGDMAALFALQESVARAGFQAPAADPPRQDGDAAAKDQAADEASQAVQARLRALRSALAQRQDVLETLRTSPTWRTLSSQPNWELWFAQQQQYLQLELQRFETALQVGPAGSVAAAASHV